jgi:hypothetical protein
MKIEGCCICEHCRASREYHKQFRNPDAEVVVVGEVFMCPDPLICED